MIEHEVGAPVRSTGERVARLLAVGLSASGLARRLGVSKPAVRYHARRVRRRSAEKYDRRYGWPEIRRHDDAVERGDVRARPPLLCPNGHSQTGKRRRSQPGRGSGRWRWRPIPRRDPHRYGELWGDVTRAEAR